MEKAGAEYAYFRDIAPTLDDHEFWKMVQTYLLGFSMERCSGLEFQTYTIVENLILNRRMEKSFITVNSIFGLCNTVENKQNNSNLAYCVQSKPRIVDQLMDFYNERGVSLLRNKRWVDTPEIILRMTKAMHRMINCHLQFRKAFCTTQPDWSNLTFLTQMLTWYEEYTLENKSKDCILKIRYYCLCIVKACVEWTMDTKVSKNASGDALFSMVLDLASSGYRTSPNANTCGILLSDLNHVFNIQAGITTYAKSIRMDEMRLEYMENVFTTLPKRSVSKQTTVEVVEDMTEQIEQVQCVFPDVDANVIRNNLHKHQGNVENTVHAMLEGRIETEASNDNVEEKEQSESRTDFVQYNHEMLQNPDNVWIGKKPLDEKYNSSTVKQDQEFTTMQKDILLQYDMVEMPNMDTFTDLYDDEYNDEYDDCASVPVSDNQNMDFEAIKEHNKEVLAKEQEQDFWESMRNKNSTGKVQAPPKAKPAAPTAEQNAGRRKYKDKNKAKIGNHNRKAQATKKQR